MTDLSSHWESGLNAHLKELLSRLSEKISDKALKAVTGTYKMLSMC